MSACQQDPGGLGVELHGSIPPRDGGLGVVGASAVTRAASTHSNAAKPIATGHAEGPTCRGASNTAIDTHNARDQRPTTCPTAQPLAKERAPALVPRAALHIAVRVPTARDATTENPLVVAQARQFLIVCDGD